MISLLVTILIVLVVCGAFALIFRYSPLPEPFKGIGVWLCLIVAVAWLLYVVFDGWRIHVRLP